jgi:uncharacterized protein YjbI with pentapeptide repeats
MVQDLIEFFQSIRVLQEKGIKQNVNYIFCSFLYSALLQEQPVWRFDAYDENHYFDEAECTGNFDTPWLFKELREACKDLDLVRRKYAGKINSAYVDIIKRQQAYCYMVFPTLIMRQALKDAVQSAEFARLGKGNLVEFRIGEYRDISEVVSSYVDSKQDSAKMKAWLEKKFDDKYFCSCLTDLDLSYGDYSACNLSYARLTKSMLRKVNLMEALLYGADFSHCLIEDSNFNECDLNGAYFNKAVIKRTNFRRCWGEATMLHEDPDSEYLTDLFPSATFCNGNLEEVDFFCASLEHTDFTNAVLSKVSFRRGSLEGAKFNNVVLNDCDFSDADLSGASFGGAVVSNCKFDGAELRATEFPQEVDHAMFTDEQRQQIIFSPGGKANGIFYPKAR